MTQELFFGYGSLVNRATHDFSCAAPAKITGWKRAWVQTQYAPQKYLSVLQTKEKAPLWGIVAAVPTGGWARLDIREKGYDRLPAHNVEHPLDAGASIQIYSVPYHAHITLPEKQGGIILSYLDVVVQGFFQEFGEEGVAHFFDTTDAWGKIINDRAKPLYPRCQTLGKHETALVDTHITRLGLSLA